MAAEVMTAPEGRIIHKTYAVLSGAAIPQRVHVTQYDESLPVIACTLYKDGQLYTIPDGASVRLRMNKNGLPVYHEAIGIDDTRHVVYLEITAQMTVLYGEFAMVLEVETSDGKTAGTSYLRLIVRQNPVQNPEIDNIPDYTANSNKLTAEGVKKLQDESSMQQKAIEDKGKNTLESIPADYSTLSWKVDKNTSGISQLSEDLTQLDERVQTIKVEGGNEDYRPNYFTDDFKITDGIRINNGVESSNKSYFATDFLPIDGIISFADFYTPLYMNGIFFYDASKTYIGKASANDIPESAKYYRISDQIIGWKALYTEYGNVAGYGLNRYYRQLPKENGGIALANNVNLVDVISDPTKPTVTINFYGDSNTYGYGVEQKSWAYYIAQGIKANFTGEYKYYVGHPHVQAFCNMNTQASPYPALKGLTNQNIEDLPYIRIRTTATSVKVGWNGTGDGNLVIDGNYDDVRAVSNGDTVTLDGALHVLDLKPTVANVMLTNPYFVIPKTIVCNNYGVAGRTSQNQELTGLNTCDIAFMMIGTNDGNNSVWEGVHNSFLLQGVVNPSKLIGILPPANRANATLMRQIAHMKTLYDVIGVRYLRIPSFNELIAMDSTLMQSDGLHYTAKGHVALANAISSECGACVNVWDGAEYSTTVSDTFSNL